MVTRDENKMFINIILFSNDMLENKMLLIGIVAAVVIIAGIAGYLLLKKPAVPPTPEENVTEENITGGGPGGPEIPTTEADMITNVPEGVTGEQTTDTAYYYVGEATGQAATFDIGKVGINLDTATNSFEVQVLLSKTGIELTDANEIANRLVTRLTFFATDVSKNVVEGENYYKIILTGTATDVDGLKAEVKSWENY